MMEFKDGTKVFTANAKQAGVLDRIVFNPETRDVTHIVITKGLLFKEDKVIPMAKVVLANSEKIVLSSSDDDLKELVPLTIEQTVTGNEGQDFEPVLGTTMNTPPVLNTYVHRETTRTIPDDLVALKEGARVMSEDDKHIGDIEDVFTENGKVTRFMVSQGTISKSRKAVPVEWVKMVGEDEVDLSVQAQQVEDSPPEPE